MDLWTEFEGVTIDKAYSLSKLLQTEGRSAFFSTRNADGEPVLIRIIECHFDEDEILARWRGVQTLGHPNFLRIDHFGQFLIESDDITAVYAVFERVDANLGDVLEQGKLSIPEAAQIGLSIVSALETLHANGFVHEHVEARNIYAVGETVKLRSDCIRETPEGEAAVAARRRDVHDLVVVLMQVLLGNPRAADMPRSGTFVARFEEIVRKGMKGEWGLAEIKAALAPYKPANTPVKQTATPAKPAQSSTPAPHTTTLPPVTKPQNGNTPKPAVVAAVPLAPAGAKSATPEKPAQAAAPTAATPAPAHFKPRPEPWAEPARAQKSRSEDRKPFGEPDRPVLDVSRWVDFLKHDERKWIAAGAALLVVLLLGWMLLRHSSHSAAAAPVAASQSADAPASTSSAPQQARSPRPLNRPDPVAPPAPAGRDQWRVVAFTYNKQDQARKKASSVAQKHPDLNADVFSPTGRAPWLVTIGGAMGRDDAYALARKAKSYGLPHDTYAQNYTAR